MKDIILIVCESHGSYDEGTWHTVDVEIPEELYSEGYEKEILEYIRENTDVIGHDTVYFNVYDWLLT